MMRIEASTVQLEVQHRASREVQLEESLRAWVGPRRPDFEGRGRSAEGPPSGGPLPRVAISEGAHRARTAELPKSDEDDPTAGQGDGDLGMALLKALTEMLTGRAVKVFDPSEMHRHRHAPPDTPGEPPQQPERAGFGIEYDRVERLEEHEQLSFAASGRITTADGRQIDFELKLDLARSFVSEERVSLRAGDAVMKDPLVLNFDGQGVRLDGSRMAFDIDADGSDDQVARLAAGSGYLVLDRNRNGQVDNGSELFGPASGNGFAELAAHDADGNGWIDEADPVFGQLSVWQPGSSLQSLQGAGVGAIYLGNAASPFALNDAANDPMGALRSSGVYLHEDGTAGLVQQIDLAV